MPKSVSTWALDDESHLADNRPAKLGLRSLRFHMAGFLCSQGILQCAYPQELVAGILGAEPVIRVDPRQITHFIPRTKSFGLLREGCFFVRGNWDLGLPEFSRNYTYEVMRHLLKQPDRERLGDGPAFKHVRSLIDFGDCPVTHRGKVLKTDTEIIRYLNACLDLRGSLLKHGYRGTANSDDFDIGLAVGTDGRLHHFSHGKHRLALAKLLGLDSVRAKIRVMHPHWYIARRRGLFVMNAGDALARGICDLSSTGGLEDRSDDVS